MCEKGFYACVKLSKEDLIEAARDNGFLTPRLEEKIKTLSDDEMQHLASKIGDTLMILGYWEAMDSILEKMT